jgi:hypothetical protein
MTRASQIALAVAVATGALLVNDNMSLTQPSSLVSQSEARIGRPLSPMSVAGVARRQDRRAVYGAGIVGTGAGLAYARYGGSYAGYGYGGWDDYATRNGIICQPGTTVRLPDGVLYLCQ